MRTSSAVKKDLSSRKLSTVRSATQAPAPVFDRQRLVSELLSLGNERLTPELAQQIGKEVEGELKRRASPHLSPEVISEIVQFKLEELGLIEIRRRHSKATRPEEEPTVSLHTEMPEPQAESPAVSPMAPLAEKIAATQLPTLEKYLRPATASTSGISLPPKASIKISGRALHRMQEVFGLEDAQLASRLENLFEEISSLAAGVERRYPGSRESEVLAVEFFNAMANQEFYPQVPVLFQFLEGAASKPQRWGPTALTWRMDAESLPALLETAFDLWRRGGDVVFSLESPKGAPATPTKLLERFFEGVERRMMALPDEQALPASVGLRLRAEHPGAADLAELALSGKYYPKFRFEWRLPEDASDFAALEPLLKVTWKKSEPSLVCFDKALGASANSRLSHSEAGHPGGSPALSRYEGGSLGSLNLSIVGAGDDVDWAKLRRMTRTAVHFLDNLSEVATGDDACETPRRLGLGVMGFAELVLKLGVPYDSDDAAVLAEKIFRFLRQEAQAAALALTERRALPTEEGLSLSPRSRHEALLAIRAEASLADLAEVSPGLEPLESVVEAGRPIALLQQIAQRRRVWTEAIAAEVVEKRSVREAESAPRPLRRLFSVRAEIAPEWPIKILGAAQRHCDLPVTGELDLPERLSFAELTENLQAARACGLSQIQISGDHAFFEEEPAPEMTTEDSCEAETEPAPIATEAAEASLALSLEDLATPDAEDITDESEEASAEETVIAELEELAVSAANPEVTDLPVDSLAASILGVGETAPDATPIPGLLPRPRPEVLQASNRLIHTGCGSMHVSFGRDAQGPYEVRAQLGQPGTCASAQTEAISRLLSLCLSTGVDQRLVYEQLRGIRCPKSAMDRGDKILSCADGIARVFERELGFAKEASSQNPTEEEEEITAVTDLATLQ